MYRCNLGRSKSDLGCLCESWYIYEAEILSQFEPQSLLDDLPPPHIQPNTFGRAEDLAPLVAGIWLARRIMAAPALAPYRGQEVWPGEAAQSDEALLAFIRHHFQTTYHPVGTCKMGLDETAVVDPRLRVHGLERLRVVDASIMPTLIAGHTHAPAVMIAEKAADMIKEDWLAAMAINQNSNQRQQSAVNGRTQERIPSGAAG